MCMAIAVRVIALNDERARVETETQQIEVGRLLVPDLAIGDWVLVNTGQIVSRITPEEADEVRALLKELNESFDRL